MSGPQQPPPIAISHGNTFFANTSINTPLTPDHDDVESPSLTSGNALARFEFEKPASDHRSGTKILMVEWEDDEQTKQIPGQWTVSWEGKKAAKLGANAEGDSREGLHRLYFLLSVAERVPGTVTLTLQSEHEDNDNDNDKEEDKKHEKVTWRTHTLPAIFPPELGASAREAGKKGFLHTVWAKKRLQVLQQEIQHEEQHSPEGVALSMAMQERDWIEQNFGVRTKPHGLKIATSSTSDCLNIGLPSPASPRSPGRGPLLEKLQDLNLDSNTGSSDHHDSNPLSPEGSDVAVNFNTFAALHGLPDPSNLSAKPPQRSLESRIPQPPQAQQQQQPQPQRRIAQHLPPQSILAQQQQNHQQHQAGSTMTMASLNAFAASETPVEFKTPAVDSPASTLQEGGNDAATAGISQSLAGDEDDLFALPLSPRSPIVGQGAVAQGGSAFSFNIDDVGRYKS